MPPDHRHVVEPVLLHDRVDELQRHAGGDHHGGHLHLGGEVDGGAALAVLGEELTEAVVVCVGGGGGGFVNGG